MVPVDDKSMILARVGEMYGTLPNTTPDAYTYGDAQGGCVCCFLPVLRSWFAMNETHAPSTVATSELQQQSP